MSIPTMTPHAPAQAAFQRAIDDIRACSNNPRVLDATYRLETLSAAYWPDESRDDAAAMDRWPGFEKYQVRIVEALRSKMGKTVSYNTVMNFVYFDRPVDDWPDASGLKVQVCRIRRLLAQGPYRIVTVHRVGYRMELAA